MTSNHLLVITRHAAEYGQLLAEANLPDLVIHTAVDHQAARPYLQTSNLILGAPAFIRHIINDAPQVSWVQSTWAGVEKLVEAPNTRQNYQLTNVRDIFGPQMSEFVFAHLIMMVRQDWARYDQQKERIWRHNMPAVIHGKRIGLIGVGSIGGDVARTGKHFGLEVWGYTRSSEGCTAVDRYFHGDRFLEFVSGVDFLINTLPHTSQSVNLLDKTVFAAMKPTSIFINIGRGSAVVERDLVTALEQGEIANAVLDVCQQEPLPPDHFLWDAPNTIITNHTSAVSFPNRVMPIFIENYQRFRENTPLKYVVDFGQGY